MSTTKKEINPDRDFYRPENKYISKKKNKNKSGSETGEQYYG